MRRTATLVRAPTHGSSAAYSPAIATRFRPHRCFASEEGCRLPAGGFAEIPQITEGRSPVNKTAVRVIRELFGLQEARISEECLPLLERLQELEGWDPDHLVELDLDES